LKDQLARAWKAHRKNLDRRENARRRELAQQHRLIRDAIRLESRGILPRAMQRRFLAEVTRLLQREVRDLNEQLLAERVAPVEGVRVWPGGLPSEFDPKPRYELPEEKRRGRPKRKIDRKTLGAAIRLRGELTRQFQREWLELTWTLGGNYTFRAAIRVAAEEHLGRGHAAIEQLLGRVESAGWRPSDAASRIAALKFGIALNRVRRGKNPARKQRVRRHNVLQAADCY